MENQTCQNCKYFYQHYGLNGKKIYRLQCGHCSHPHLRNRKPMQKACPEFVQGEIKEKEFVSKDYLYKFLLDWIRQLEHLPEIQEQDIP